MSRPDPFFPFLTRGGPAGRIIPMGHIGLSEPASAMRPLRRRLSPLALLAAALFLLCSLSHAAYLSNIPQSLRQPDGTPLHCLASGDEYFNWLHDSNGYTIVQDPDTGYYMYAAPGPSGTLAPSAHIAGRSNPAALGFSPRLLPSAAVQQRLRASARRLFLSSEPTPAPRTGTINNLVVFIRFSGESEFTDSPSTFTQMLNASGASDNSMYHYFYEASYSRLAVASTLYPTPAATILSYQDAYTRGYYQPYNAVSNTIGYTGGNNGAERTIREHTLLKNAVAAIAAQVPSGLVIDADGDGRVDNIVFVVYGSPTGWATLLWPHQWALYTQSAYINGKRVYTYNLQLRTTIDTGVLCHEMFHSIGAPDLYHYSYDGLTPVGAWDIMEYDANPPQHMGAFMKWRYGTWISSIPEITAAGTYSLSPLTSATGNCYKIRSPNSTTEYFLLEYRRRTGIFESSLPGEGLLVYRINSAQDGLGNDAGPPDEVYIYRLDGTLTANGQVNSAAFSSASGRTVINDTTNPSSFLSDGSAGGLRVSNVGAVGSTISFMVSFPPAIKLSTAKLRYGAVVGGSATRDQKVTVSNAGQGTFAWTASSSQSWLSVTPTSGTDTGTLTIRANPSGLSAGSYAGTIAVTSAGASNSPQNIAVDFTVYAAGSSASPFGSFDTPTNNATVMSSIAVTGWSLDDIEVTGVKIYRNPVGAETGTRIYIGDGTFIEGSRPDVETVYPYLPLNYRAGWGYMLLTNFMPGGGNGTFTLYAYATDKEGHEALIGSKTITCDNLHAVKPFGAIDTPTQGGEISGALYYNFGWALTPMPNMIPTDGSTLGVWIDGELVGRPKYNNFRDDIAALFPGYANSNGAVGVFDLDTTAYENGMHNIAWSVRDNAGNEDGVGSRFFWILNTGTPAPEAQSGGEGSDSGRNSSGARGQGALSRVSDLTGFMDRDGGPIYIRRGYDRSGPPESVVPRRTFNPGNAVIPRPGEGPVVVVEELERIEILLGDKAWASDADRRAAERAGLALTTSGKAAPKAEFPQKEARWEGYLIVGDELRRLPIGSTFDSAAGIFSWLPGPGFLGDYQLVFVERSSRLQQRMTIKIGVRS